MMTDPGTQSGAFFKEHTENSEPIGLGRTRIQLFSDDWNLFRIGLTTR